MIEKIGACVIICFLLLAFVYSSRYGLKQSYCNEHFIDTTEYQKCVDLDYDIIREKYDADQAKFATNNLK